MPYEDVQKEEQYIPYMNIQEDFKFEEVKEVETSPQLTLDEAFAADTIINTIEDLANITIKMDTRASADDQNFRGETENSVIIAGQKFKRTDVEMWLVDQEFDNKEEDGANSPDASLEAAMKVFNVTKYISLGDLVSTLKGAGMNPEALLAEKDPLSDDMLEVLYHMGLNTTDYKVLELVDTHRDVADKAVTCLRFVGEERQDNDWLGSGQASWEARVAAKGDESLERELASIGRR